MAKSIQVLRRKMSPKARKAAARLHKQVNSSIDDAIDNEESSKKWEQLRGLDDQVRIINSSASVLFGHIDHSIKELKKLMYLLCDCEKSLSILTKDDTYAKRSNAILKNSIMEMINKIRDIENLYCVTLKGSQGYK